MRHSYPLQWDTGILCPNASEVLTMLQNVGRVDATIRVILGVALLVIAAVFNATPLISFVAAIAALVMLGTAVTGNCPLYTLLHLSSCPRPR